MTAPEPEKAAWEFHTGPGPEKVPEVYAAMVARRLQWDSLVWQVPVMSLTAQAFLLTIALSADSSRLARGVACVLSMIAAVLAVQLMTRHRQAEIADATWLNAYERKHFPGNIIHGPSWRERRDAQDPEAGKFFNVFRAGGPDS